MILLLSQAIFFALPFILAGIVHITVIKFGLMKSLAKYPLDGGLKLNGRPLFGKNKTVRGAVTIVVSITLFWILAGVAVRNIRLASKLSVSDITLMGSLSWGFLLGLGWVLGELPNSFLKRRLNIAPGADPAKGFLRPFFWVLDQVDGLLGVLTVSSFRWRPSLGMIVALVVVALVIHPLGTAMMVALGLKRGVGPII